MKVIQLFIVLFLISQTGYGINYPFKKGKGEIGIGYKTTTYTSEFDQDGELRLTPKTRTSQFLIEGNYGVTDRICLSLSAPIMVKNKVFKNTLHNIESDLNYTGPGDIELGVGYAFVEQKKLMTIATFKHSIGIGTSDQKDGLNTGYGDYANALYFDIFYKPNTSLFFDLCAGGRIRGMGFSDDFLGEALAGWHLSPSFDLKGSISGQVPFEYGSDSLVGGYFGLYRNNAGYLISTVSFAYNYQHTVGASIEFSNYIKGQFIGAAPIFGIKLYYLFDGEENADDKK